MLVNLIPTVWCVTEARVGIKSCNLGIVITCDGQYCYELMLTGNFHLFSLLLIIVIDRYFLLKF